jgi:hypothetical protein
MTPEQLEALLNYIDARFAELQAQYGSDGDMLEGIHADELRDKLMKLVKE